MNKRLVAVFAEIAAIIFLIGTVLGLVYAPAYKADALLIPKANSGSDQLGGLASAGRMLGLSVGGQNTSFSRFTEYWGSRDIAQRLLDKHPDLVRELYPDDWDPEANRWYTGPHTFKQHLVSGVYGVFGVKTVFGPTSQQLSNYIKSAMKLEANEGKEIHISYSGHDPALIVKALTTVINETDAFVRQAERRRYDEFTRFAIQRLNQETNVEYKTALIQAIQQYEISGMYAAAGDNFAFQYAESPNLEAPTPQPTPAKFFTFLTVFSLFTAFVLSSLLATWPNSWFAALLYGLHNKAWFRLVKNQ